MKCKDCNVWKCQHRALNGEPECVLQNVAGHIITQSSEGTKEFLVLEGSAITVDWQAFRREVAKDILVGICANWGKGFAGKLINTPDVAIELADTLIAKLKQE